MVRWAPVSSCCCLALLLVHLAGDDLPGLLHNWGSGLHTISKHATVSGRAPCIVCVSCWMLAGLKSLLRSCSGPGGCTAVLLML